MLTSDRRMLTATAGDNLLCLLPRMANRHGLVTGATGTGKTVTLQTITENFSQLGVPVFLADVKGDLSGMARAGVPSGKVAERIASLGLTRHGYLNQAYPVCFWDVFGQKGHPLRTTISEMGPLLLARLLHLNDVQSGILQLVFKIADDTGLLLLDMKDLRAMLQYVSERRQEFQAYGNISTASIGAIQRALLGLEQEGAEKFFGEPALRIADLMRTDSQGRGVINILAADSLVNSPRVYSSLLLWLLSELFETLPESGDQEKPKLIFFFDEAHLLFDEANPVLLQKIEQVVRLIRSRGVGVYFVSQNPADIPDSILGQLGNRVQHALRAFTPKDRKAVRAAAQSFRSNPAFDTETVIGELGVGEALVSFLDEKGAPQIVERAYIVPPQAHIGTLTLQERQDEMLHSPVAGLYERAYDRESAYEVLVARAQQQTRTCEQVPGWPTPEPVQQIPGWPTPVPTKRAPGWPTPEPTRKPEQRRSRQKRPADGLVDGLFENLAKQTTRTVTNTVGREIGKTILRGLLGGLLGGKR